MNDTVLMSASEVLALANEVLRRLGYADAEANVIARHLLDAACCGYGYSGLPKLLNMIDYHRRLAPRDETRVVHETPVSIRIDGGNNNGMLVLDRATDQVIAKATREGFAVGAVRRTWMSGRSAYFVERMARAGLIGWVMIGSRPQVAPPGARTAALGTNPLAIGFPNEPDPLVVDMGTSAVMFTELQWLARQGASLPPGVAIDAEGRPATDASVAAKGAALSWAGHKGYALAVAMAALATLAGDDGGDHSGYFLMALSVSLLMSPADFARDLSALLTKIKATPRAAGVDEIRLPSERACAARRNAAMHGIEVDARCLESLRAWLAQRRGN
jgi:LDH2 family malate/lactate/ureidoglycolate dehydrogenase